MLVLVVHSDWCAEPLEGALTWLEAATDACVDARVVGGMAHHMGSTLV